MQIRDHLNAAAERLQGQSDTPRLDAELLLCHALGVSRTYLYTWPEREPDVQQAGVFAALLARREAGEPVAHLLGEREFWSLALGVNAATLIPRPETERLVEAALERIPAEATWAIADLGTGSGAIALAVASERPGCRITAVERCAAALAVAWENAGRHGLANVELLHGSWYGPLEGRRFRLILSNPPYIRADDPHLRQGDVRFEPITALASGADGLDDIRLIIAGAPAHLEAGGWLLLEHGYDQGEAVCALLRAAGFVEVADLADLQGLGRVALGQLPGA